MRNPVNNSHHMPHRAKVVIVGGGFGGLTSAMHLGRDLNVLLIDPSPWFEFLPNIHELVSLRKEPSDLRLHRGSILDSYGHQFLQDRVVAINPKKKLVECAKNNPIQYDYCVVAMGVINNTFNVSGADQFSMPFKSVEECHRIGLRLRALVNDGNPCSIIIVGGGLEGVETLGEILRRYRHRHMGIMEIHLVDSNNRLLNEAPSVLDTEIRRHCRPFPITFHCGLTVEAVTQDSIHLSDGTQLRADMTIWTGGGKLPSLMRESGLAKVDESWAPVHPTLQSQYHDAIFVVGDVAQLHPSVAKQAYHAVDMGACAAQNIRKMIKGRPPARFMPKAKPTLISFGDMDTFLVADELVLAGPSLSFAKEAVYQRVMAQIQPALTTTGVISLVTRLSRGIRDLLLPEVYNISPLKKLTDTRFLQVPQHWRKEALISRYPVLENRAGDMAISALKRLLQRFWGRV